MRGGLAARQRELPWKLYSASAAACPTGHPFSQTLLTLPNFLPLQVLLHQLQTSPRPASGAAPRVKLQRGSLSGSLQVWWSPSRPSLQQSSNTSRCQHHKHMFLNQQWYFLSRL